MSPQTQPSHQRPNRPQPSHQLPELIGRVRRVRTGPVVTQKWGDREISTGAAKAPHAGRVIATENGLDGDAQGNLKVHGGPNKAMCCYPFEFMAQWAADGFDLPEGTFFENLTLEGLPDQVVYLGDIFELNDLTVQVTQPRRPCATVSSPPRKFPERWRATLYRRLNGEFEDDTARLGKP